MITIKTTVDKGTIERSLSTLPDMLDDYLNRALAKVFMDMSVDAKYQHRYTVRTGNLQKATHAEVKELTGELSISDIKAHYGVYVHQGHHTWSPDQFVYKAFANKRPALDRSLAEAVNQAIKDSGLK